MSEIGVGSLDEFADGDHRVVAVGDFEVGIFRRGEKLYAYENRCPHLGGPVCQGKIFRQVEEVIGADRGSEGLRFAPAENVVCPWHGYEYNLVTGCHPGDPSLRLTPVPVRVDKGRVYLQVPG